MGTRPSKRVVETSHGAALGARLNLPGAMRPEAHAHLDAGLLATFDLYTVRLACGCGLESSTGRCTRSGGCSTRPCEIESVCGVCCDLALVGAARDTCGFERCD